MLTTIIAFCSVFNPAAPILQGYQPIVKSSGATSIPFGDGVFGGPPPPRAVWYTQSTHRVDLTVGLSQSESFPVEVILKFETPTQIVGLEKKDYVRKIVVPKADELVKVYYTTTNVQDDLTLAVYIGEKKFATLVVGILKAVVGAGTPGGA